VALPDGGSAVPGGDARAGPGGEGGVGVVAGVGGGGGGSGGSWTGGLGARTESRLRPAMASTRY